MSFRHIYELQRVHLRHLIDLNSFDRPKMTLFNATHHFLYLCLPVSLHLLPLSTSLFVSVIVVMNLITSTTGMISTAGMYHPNYVAVLFTLCYFVLKSLKNIILKLFKVWAVNVIQPRLLQYVENPKPNKPVMATYCSWAMIGWHLFRWGGLWLVSRISHKILTDFSLIKNLPRQI